MGVEIKDGQQPQQQQQQACGANPNTSNGMPLVSLNHVSFVCRSVAKSAKFYEGVLGFQLIKRPSSFNFEGAWLFAYGIGIHLLKAASCGRQDHDQDEEEEQQHAKHTLPTCTSKKAINPKDNHISFQCSDMPLVMRRLQALAVDYVTATVEEGGVTVEQLFFHDPDGYMVEICNCNNLPVLPLDSFPNMSSSSSNCNTCPTQNINNHNDVSRFGLNQGPVAVPNAAATVR